MLTVRYFAAARAAAGTETETVGRRAGHDRRRRWSTHLAERGPRARESAERCSFLCDGVAVRDQTAELTNGQTIDVLPPFAGG